MKKIILFLSFVFMLCGCGKFDDEDLVKQIDEKIAISEKSAR